MATESNYSSIYLTQIQNKYEATTCLLSQTLENKTFIVIMLGHIDKEVMLKIVKLYILFRVHCKHIQHSNTCLYNFNLGYCMNKPMNIYTPIPLHLV